MKFYHGTQNKDLKKLVINHNKSENLQGEIYLTSSYAMSLMYAGCPVRLFRWDKEKNKLIIRECCKDGLKIMYKGVKCYIFTCSAPKAKKVEKHHSGHVYVSSEEVILDENPEVITDVYEKLLELEKNDEIILDRWESKTKDEQKKEYEGAIKTFKPAIEIEKREFPFEYELLIKMFPELKIKE